MILLFMLLLALAFSLPLLLVFYRTHAPTTQRGAAMALYRAQLAALPAGTASYEGARLELERRLLAADKLAPEPMGGSAKLLLILTVIVLPIGGFVLYLPGSTPFVPSEPHARVMAEHALEQQKLDQLITLLRQHLAQVPQNSANASQGEAYLAEALTEQAGRITPEALALFRASLAHAPLTASWRPLVQQRLMQASLSATGHN